MTTMISGRSETAEGQAGFFRVLYAEWTKFRTVRGWVIGILIAAVLIDVIGLVAAGNSNTSCGNGGPAQTGSACTPSVPTGPGGEAVIDNFYFARQPLAGDGSITVRTTSMTGVYSAGNVGPGGPGGAGQGSLAGFSKGLQPWSKAGVIIKASTKPGSAYASMMVTGTHGVRMQDNYTQDSAGLPGTVSATSPRWLRLTRTGDTITGYDSADGTHWSRVGVAHLAGLPATVQIGLFAASPDTESTSSFFGGSSSTGGPSLATGTFDRVSLSGANSGGAWTGGTIGTAADGQTPVTNEQGFKRTGTGLTVSGTGDIVPMVPGGQGSATLATIEDHLLGAFGGLVVVVVIAVMLITAEYRRGMIRITVAAVPRRGRVLVAKAIVIGLVTFVAGLVAAVIAVTVGVKLSRDQGSYVLPVTWQTEARVIAGTAALLAVAAILALAVGVVVRRSAAAVATVIVGIVLSYILGTASVLPAGAADWLLRATPAAAFSIQQSIPSYPQVTAAYSPPIYFPLSPWAGFAVLCGYAVAALALAFILLRRRDV